MTSPRLAVKCFSFGELRWQLPFFCSLCFTAIEGTILVGIDSFAVNLFLHSYYVYPAEIYGLLFILYIIKLYILSHTTTDMLSCLHMTYVLRTDRSNCSDFSRLNAHGSPAIPTKASFEILRNPASYYSMSTKCDIYLSFLFKYAVELIHRKIILPLISCVRNKDLGSLFNLLC